MSVVEINLIDIVTIILILLKRFVNSNSITKRVFVLFLHSRLHLQRN